MSIEDAIKTLEQAGVTIFDRKQVEGEFNRHVDFSLNGHIFRITWWPNVMHLTGENGMMVIFTSFYVSGTWPNQFKTNLQFKNGDEYVCIIGVE